VDGTLLVAPASFWRADAVHLVMPAQQTRKRQLWVSKQTNLRRTRDDPYAPIPVVRGTAGGRLDSTPQRSFGAGQAKCWVGQKAVVRIRLLVMLDGRPWRHRREAWLEYQPLSLNVTVRNSRTALTVASYAAWL
jgi:hypothetical protein